MNKIEVQGLLHRRNEMRINFSGAARGALSVIENVRDNVQNIVSGINKPASDSDILIENIRQARYDLERAESLFNELTDESAIDYAAYSILAARAKYVYLIGLAKKLDIKF